MRRHFENRLPKYMIDSLEAVHNHPPISLDGVAAAAEPISDVEDY